MSKMHWDAIGEKAYEYGVSKGVLFRYNATSNKWVGVPWNGLTNVTESPDGGDAEDYYADNMLYAKLRGIESLNGSIECFTYPDEFKPCIGHGELANGVTIGQQDKEPFAIAYRTEKGNDANHSAGYKLHFVYNCTANAAEMSHDTTEDSPNLEPLSFDYDSTPVDVPGHKPASSLTIDSNTVSAAALKAIEDAIYGTDAVAADAEHNIEAVAATDSYLPYPAALQALIATADGDSETIVEEPIVEEPSTP